MRSACEFELAKPVLVRRAAREREAEVRIVLGQSGLTAVSVIHLKPEDRAVRLQLVERGGFVVVPGGAFESCRQLEVQFKAGKFGSIQLLGFYLSVFRRQRRFIHGHLRVIEKSELGGW